MLKIKNQTAKRHKFYKEIREDKKQKKMSGLVMWEIIKKYLYKSIVATIILLVGLLMGSVTKKILRKLLQEIELDKVIKKLGKKYSLEKRLSNLAAYLIYIITFFFVLDYLKITFIILYIILGVLLLIIGGTFLLGIKDFIPNFLGGLIIYRRKYEVGKKIKVGRVEGRIERIGLLEMEIRTKKGDLIYLPNSLLVKTKVLLRPLSSLKKK